MKSSDFEPDNLRIFQLSSLLIGHLIVWLDSRLTRGNNLLDSHEEHIWSSASASHLAILCSLATEPVALLQGRASISVGNVLDMYMNSVGVFVFPYLEKEIPCPYGEYENCSGNANIIAQVL